MEDFSNLKNNFENFLANTTNIKIEETQKKIQRCYIQCYICDKEFENLVSHNNFDSTTVTVHENNKEIFSPPKKITVEIKNSKCGF